MNLYTCISLLKGSTVCGWCRSRYDSLFVTTIREFFLEGFWESYEMLMGAIRGFLVSIIWGFRIIILTISLVFNFVIIFT